MSFSIRSIELTDLKPALPSWSPHEFYDQIDAPEYREDGICRDPCHGMLQGLGLAEMYFEGLVKYVQKQQELTAARYLAKLCLQHS